MAEMLGADHVGKSYSRHRSQRPHTLKDAALSGFRRMNSERFWALDDVTFAVEEGRTVGLIGPNGAGKSTLLRVLAGVEHPDRGSLRRRGRLAVLLELGVGFQPELTGRENVILGGVIAGLTRREVRRRMDSLIAFAGLEDAIDRPLRTYSSGMQARLGFSLAIHVDPQVLLIDEVLAVGDLAFQRRCIDKIRDFQKNGVTTVVVSHVPDRVREICDEVIWLRSGRVFAHGPADEIVDRYVAAVAEETEQLTPVDLRVMVTSEGVPLEPRRNRFGSQEASIERVRLQDGWGNPGSEIMSGSSMRIVISVVAPPRQGLATVVTLWRKDGTVCLNLGAEHELPGNEGPPWDLVLEMDRMDLVPGDYVFDVGLYASGWDRCYDFHEHAYPLRIIGDVSAVGVLAPPHRWQFAQKERVRNRGARR